MAVFIDKATQWLVKKEASYGVAPTFSYSTDGVQFVNPSMDGSTELIERDVIVNSLVAAKPVLGMETCSGSFTVELTAPESGAVNGDVLFESAMGRKVAAVAADAAAIGSSATTVTVTSGASYAPGQGLKVEFTGGEIEYVTITSISGNILTVEPALVTAFADVDSVTGLVTYLIGNPDTATVSFSVREYLEAAVAIEYTYNGCVADSMTLNLPVGGIATADFSVSGAGFAVASGVANQVKKCYDLTPFVGKNFTFTYDDVSYAVADVSLNVSNEVTDTMGLTTDGITNKTIVAKSELGGSFTLDYTGIALFEQYQNGTTGALYALSPVADASRVFVYAPNVMLSNVTKSVDGGLYKDNVDFRLLDPADCTDGVNRALSICFG